MKTEQRACAARPSELFLRPLPAAACLSEVNAEAPVSRIIFLTAFLYVLALWFTFRLARAITRSGKL